MLLAVMMSQGKTYYMMKKYKESLADLNKSLEIEPNDSWVLKQRGKTYYIMNKYEESLADVTKSLEIEPNDAWALKQRGKIYCVNTNQTLYINHYNYNNN